MHTQDAIAQALAAASSSDRSAAETAADIRAGIEQLVDARAEGATVCPSEVARAIAGEDRPWRELMPGVRAAAAQLALEGRLVVTRAGVEVDAMSTGGPIRLARRRASAQGKPNTA